MTNNCDNDIKNVKDTKDTEKNLAGNIMGTYYEPEDENTPRHSEAIQIKYLHQTLNSINAFLLLIVN